MKMRALLPCVMILAPLLVAPLTSSWAEMQVVEIQAFRRPQVKVFELVQDAIVLQKRVPKEAFGQGPWPILGIDERGFYQIDIGGERLWVAKTDVEDGRVVDLPPCRQAGKGTNALVRDTHTFGIGENCVSGGK